MSQRVLPTKINLISLRRQLRLVQQVKRLLESKREVLLIYLRTYIAEYERTYYEVSSLLKEIYSHFLMGATSQGIHSVELLAAAAPSNLTVIPQTRNLFGVKVTVLKLDKQTVNKPFYGSAEVSPLLYSAHLEMAEALDKVLELVEKETAIRMLAEELRRTQRLINAIDNYILPNIRRNIKFVAGVLSDRTREEFIRLKMIRKILQRKR
ncbi:MAG: V-type ATP synthase subunit D [Sulfolobales archaeon]|jgi:V/A-type H+-transporting ATPase subunit D|nr:V-type ATP synthase subunit D [Sulfolobales archaeon]MDT7899701.1 V-type ATP synthase subunit D [Sulfolobales archaeon]